MPLTPRETFFFLISNDRLMKADAIIVLEGDGLARIPHGAQLFREGWAPLVVLSGANDTPPHSIVVSKMLPYLLEAGVPRDAVILEEKSQNTREQGVEVVRMARERGWKRIILVASHYHQYRAYLTFLKALQESGYELALINSPARDLSWFEKTEGGQAPRIELLQGEMDRIEAYTPKGHIASFESAIEYQKWKETL